MKRSLIKEWCTRPGDSLNPTSRISGIGLYLIEEVYWSKGKLPVKRSRGTKNGPNVFHPKGCNSKWVSKHAHSHILDLIKSSKPVRTLLERYRKIGWHLTEEAYPKH